MKRVTGIGGIFFPRTKQGASNANSWRVHGIRYSWSTCPDGVGPYSIGMRPMVSRTGGVILVNSSRRRESALPSTAKVVNTVIDARVRKFELGHRSEGRVEPEPR